MAKFIFQWDIAQTRAGHKDVKLGTSATGKILD